MATSSFDRNFVVKDKKAADKLRQALSKEHVIKVKVRNIDEENKKGLELLKKLPSV